MKLSRHLGIGAALATFWLLTACDAFVSTEGRISRAEEALEAGELGRAAIDLNKVVDKEPGNVQARLLLARLSLRLADVSGAEAAIKRAVEAGADAQAVEALQVESLLLAGKAAEADSRIQGNQVLAQPERGVLLGRALLEQGKAAEALAAFDAALAADNDNRSALAGRAEALAATASIDEAMGVVDAALAADKTNWEASVLKGRLLMAKGDQKAAEEQFRQALQYMGGSANLRQIVGLRAVVAELALGARNIGAAENDVARLQQMASGSPAAELLAAKLSLAKGDRRDAAARLQAALLAAPDMAPARMLLASVHAAEGNLMQAEAQLQGVVAQEPGNTAARKQLAQVRLQLDNPEGAANALTPALAADARDPQLLQLMDATQRSESATGKSLVDLRRAFEEKPDSASLRLAYARALLTAKRPAEALKLVSSNTPVGDTGVYWAIRLASTAAVQGPAAARAEADRLMAARRDDTALVLAATGLLVSQREPAKAKEILLKGRQADPKSVNLILMLAQMEQSLGNSPAAEKLLADAMAEQPNVLQIRLALVDLQAQRNDFDTAITTLRAADNAGESVDVQWVLARLELARGNLENGQKALDRVIELSPGDAQRVFASGSLLSQSRQFDAALARFQKAAEMAPATPTYHLAIAQTQLQRAQPAVARRAAERAAELDPKSIQPVALLAAMDVLDKKPDAAVQRAESWQKAHPTDPAAQRLLGETLLSAKRNEAAVKVYADLQKAHPSAQHAAKLHQLLAAANDAAADRPLLDWLKSHEEDLQTRMALALHYTNVGNWQKAAPEYEKLLASYPGDPVTLNNLAWSYYSLKDKRALATAEKAYQASNAAPPIADTYGWILIEQGDFQRGLPVLKKAAEAQPQHADLQLHYGVALGRAGQKKEGLAVLEKAATIEKDESKRAEVHKRIAELRGQL